jgi:hypothetical protein
VLVLGARYSPRVRREEFMESVRERRPWVDLVWVLALMGLGLLVAWALDSLGAPVNILTTVVCLLPLAVFALIRSSQRG